MGMEDGLILDHVVFSMIKFFLFNIAWSDSGGLIPGGLTSKVPLNH